MNIQDYGAIGEIVGGVAVIATCSERQAGVNTGRLVAALSMRNFQNTLTAFWRRNETVRRRREGRWLKEKPRRTPPVSGRSSSL